MNLLLRPEQRIKPGNKEIELPRTSGRGEKQGIELAGFSPKKSYGIY